MKKTITGILAAAVLSFGLTGCGENQIPDMTDAELQMVGEYAAITLMKYDANNRSRLVELPEESVPQASGFQVNTEQKEPSGMGLVDDTPVVNSQGGDIGNSYTMEELLGLSKELHVNYLGYELCDSYPYDEAGNYMTVAAVQGKKLLVLRFSIANNSGQELNADLLSNNADYRITVNGSVTRQALMTMLEDDMITYMGTIPAGGSEEVVLIAEIEDSVAAELSSVSLKVKNDSKAYTIQLF